MAAGPPKVFISYSHDSPEHEQRVLELANRLRRDGIDCTIDQYVVVPEEGWPRWMDKQIRDSDFVVMVCTETYYQRVGHTSSVRAMAVTPDGRHVVSGSLDHTLRVWDLATGETETTLEGHKDWIRTVAVTPDGRHVVSGSEDSTLRVWDLAAGEDVL